MCCSMLNFLCVVECLFCFTYTDIKLLDTVKKCKPLCFMCNLQFSTATAKQPGSIHSFIHAFVPIENALFMTLHILGFSDNLLNKVPLLHCFTVKHFIYLFWSVLSLHYITNCFYPEITLIDVFFYIILLNYFN